MTKRDYRLFIEDILDSMHMIEEYIHDLDHQDFSADRKTIDAVIRNIEIIVKPRGISRKASERNILRFPGNR